MFQLIVNSSSPGAVFLQEYAVSSHQHFLLEQQSPTGAGFLVVPFDFVVDYDVALSVTKFFFITQKKKRGATCFFTTIIMDCVRFKIMSTASVVLAKRRSG